MNRLRELTMRTPGNGSRNAVLNAALDKEPEDWQHIFVGLLRELQPAQVQLLSYADNPESFLNEAQKREVENQIMTNIFMFVKWAFPSWSKEFYEQLRRGLESNGLAGLPDGSMTAHGAISPRTTSVGKRFLAFLQDPLEE